MNRIAMKMNKFLLFLMVASGFLLIIYQNSDIFSKHFFHYNKSKNVPKSTSSDTATATTTVPTPNNAISQESKAPRAEAMIARAPNSDPEFDEFNIFIIYTKENYQLQKKFELFTKSLLKFSTVDNLHLHIISDRKSEVTADKILREQIEYYRKPVHYKFYDVHGSAEKIKDIVHSMMPFFSSNPGSYYSDALFYLSLGLHRIADSQMNRAILIDCDIVFRTDVRLLFDEFKHFSSDNIFGLSPELTPVYRHILYRYRANFPNTSFGSPYYYTSTPGRKHLKHKQHIRHGYPGLNSGIVMLNLKRIRESQLFEESLKEEYVKQIANKYMFKGHLGDQDFYTLLGYEFPSLIFRLDCVWNRQLCTWWKDHGYSDVFDAYFHCEGNIRIYHGNCNTRVPE